MVSGNGTKQQMEAEFTQLKATIAQLEQYRALVHISPDFIILADRQYTLQYINHLQPGLDESEVIGKSVMDFIPPDFHDTARTAIDAVFSGKETAMYETISPTPDGQTMWYETRVRPIRKDGDTPFVALIATDITERKRISDELEYQRLLLREVIDAIPDLIYVKDENGRYILANRATAEVYQTTPAQMIDKLDSDLGLNEEQQAEFVENIRHILRTGITSTFETYFYNPAMGEHRHYEARILPMTSVSNDKKLVVSVTSDITPRKQAEEELRASESRYRQILNSIEDFVLVKGEKSRIIWANHAFREYYGMTEDELQGIVDAPFAEPDYTQQYVLDDEKVFTTGQVLDIPEEPVKRHDGTVKLFHTVKSPIYDEHDQIIMTVGVSRDITERQKVEQEREQLITELQAARRIAEENSRLKSEFLATMSHELRTPMNAIEGFTSIMLSKMGGAQYNDSTERYISRVNTNSKRLLSLINDFLDLSRVESGRLELAHMPFSPVTLAQRWKDEIGVLADKKNLNFEMYVSPDLPDTLVGDEEAISKVVLNLLSNAIKFTELGSVKLTLEAHSGEWQIVVSDTGIGIPPHAREYVFDEFRQVDQTSKRKYGGTGLGLAIVQKYTRAMGGSVALQSELGRGSVFMVNLPLVVAQLS